MTAAIACSLNHTYVAFSTLAAHRSSGSLETTPGEDWGYRAQAGLSREIS